MLAMEDSQVKETINKLVKNEQSIQQQQQQDDENNDTAAQVGGGDCWPAHLLNTIRLDLLRSHDPNRERDERCHYYENLYQLFCQLDKAYQEKLMTYHKKHARQHGEKHNNKPVLPVDCLQASELVDIKQQEVSNVSGDGNNSVHCVRCGDSKESQVDTGQSKNTTNAGENCSTITTTTTTTMGRGRHMTLPAWKMRECEPMTTTPTLDKERQLSVSSSSSVNGGEVTSGKRKRVDNDEHGSRNNNNNNNNKNNNSNKKNCQSSPSRPIAIHEGDDFGKDTVDPKQKKKQNPCIVTSTSTRKGNGGATDASHSACGQMTTTTDAKTTKRSKTFTPAMKKRTSFGFPNNTTTWEGRPNNRYKGRNDSSSGASSHKATKSMPQSKRGNVVPPPRTLSSWSSFHDDTGTRRVSVSPDCCGQLVGPNWGPGEGGGGSIGDGGPLSSPQFIWDAGRLVLAASGGASNVGRGPRPAAPYVNGRPVEPSRRFHGASAGGRPVPPPHVNVASEPGRPKLDHQAGVSAVVATDPFVGTNTQHL